MAYTPPNGDAINVVMVGGYTPPSGDSIGVAVNAPEPYTPPAGDAVNVELHAGYNPPAGDQINIILGYADSALNASAAPFTVTPLLSGTQALEISSTAAPFVVTPGLSATCELSYTVTAPAFSAQADIAATGYMGKEVPPFALDASLKATTEINDPWSVYAPKFTASPQISNSIGQGIAEATLSINAELSGATIQAITASAFSGNAVLSGKESEPILAYAAPFTCTPALDQVLSWGVPAVLKGTPTISHTSGWGLPVPVLSSSGTFLVDVEDGSEWARFVKDHGDEAVKLYYCTLTGAADGLDDIQLPMTSFQARLRKEGLSYLQVVTPGIDNLEAISNRPNGTIIIDMAYILQGETRYVEQIASAAFERVDYAEGGLNKSTTLSGHSSPANEAPKQVALKNITYRSVSGGKARTRCSVPDLYLKPGDTAILPDISYEVGLITTTVSISPAGRVVSSMEVAA